MQNAVPPGYDDDDLVQQGSQVISRLSDTDVRSSFQHDVDRILYSTEFRALAGKTQVIASDQLGGYHNRLTHSLKVAQIGKRMSVMLTRRLEQNLSQEFVGPDPDLVEAAGLLHDIGHPPFGHVGESAIRSAMNSAKKRSGTLATADVGFQANAQNLRIATYLSVKRERAYRGLNLTRAALDSSTKYPWREGGEGYGKGHWGCYATEKSAETLKWVLNDEHAPFESPAMKPDQTSATQGLRRPIEEQIMDWADEVTYACHDVEDFFQAGLLPFDQVLGGVPRADTREGEPNELGYETGRFVQSLVDQEEFTEERAVKVLQNVRNTVTTLYRFEDTWDGRGRSASATSRLIAYFMGGKPVAPMDDEPDGHGLEIKPLDDTGLLTRYHATLIKSDDLQDACRVLNGLIWFYVIDRPGLASQQHGQARIVRDLIDWYSTEPKRTLPPGRKEEYCEHDDALRAAADTVSGLTEAEAVRLHRRMSGIDWGQITDLA